MAAGVSIGAYFLGLTCQSTRTCSQGAGARLWLAGYFYVSHHEHSEGNVNCELVVFRRSLASSVGRNRLGRASLSFSLFICGFLSVCVLGATFGSLFHAVLLGVPFVFGVAASAARRAREGERWLTGPSSAVRSAQRSCQYPGRLR